MEKDAKIFVAGHKGLVGSSILSALKKAGYTKLVTRSRQELDLTRQKETEAFFESEGIDYVFLAAARVGGIMANSTYPAEFIYQNLMIATNVIDASYRFGVKKLLNLGSSCIYPKFAPQPIREEHLLTGILEPTNEAYAMAKISAIKLCRYYNQQYGTNFISVMPTNLYGLQDNFDLFTSHVLPALIRKLHLAKLLKANDIAAIRKDFSIHGSPVKSGEEPTDSAIRQALLRFGISQDSLSLWGTGSPYREFLYVDDLAEACVFLMQKYSQKEVGEFVNIGASEEIQIKQLAKLIAGIVGYEGNLQWDPSKPDGTPRKFIDSSKINQLGWKATISLQDGIKSVYESYVGWASSFKL